MCGGIVCNDFLSGSSVQSQETKMLQGGGQGLGIRGKAQGSCEAGSRVNHVTWSDGCSDGDTSQDRIARNCEGQFSHTELV